MWWERGAWDSLYPLLSLLLYKWILGKPPVLHVLMAWLVFQGNMHRCSLCQIAPVWVFREQFESRGNLGSFMAQVFPSFGACTKLELVWLRGRVHPSQWGNKRNTSLHVVSKEELVRDVRVSVRLGCHDWNSGVQLPGRVRNENSRLQMPDIRGADFVLFWGILIHGWQHWKTADLSTVCMQGQHPSRNGLYQNSVETSK